jgi:hypothetical protein
MDVGLEVGDGGVNTPLDLLSGEFGELSGHVLVGPASEPRFDLGCLVTGVIVH